VSDLTLSEYQKAAMRTHDDSIDRMGIYALGLAGEAGEVADIVKKYLGHGHELDQKALVLELGDVLWYIAGLAQLLGVNLAVVGGKNIEKLNKRYPTGFSHAASVNREEDK